jgi:hypothetical protein
MTGPTGRSAALAQLVEVLNRLKVLQDGASRELVVSQIEAWTGERVPADDLARLVEVAAGRPAGLATLIDLVGGMEGQTPDVRRVGQLYDEWEAFDLLPNADLVLLREILRDQPVDIGAAVPPHIVSADHDTAWSAFVHLAGYNAGPDGVPPCMAFLERLADQLGSDVAARVRAWNDDVATDLGIMRQLRTVRDWSGPHADVTSGSSLIVQLEPDPLDADIYRLSHWTRHDPAGGSVQRGEDSIVTMTDLPARVEELIERVDPASASAVTLEFVVPHTLLDLPFELWSRAPAGDYSVVLRSLERIQSRKWHRPWHERWRHLRQDSSPRVFWANEAEGSARDLADSLAENKDVVCLVLSTPPGQDSRQELQVALRSGVPVIIWHREDCSTESFLNDLPLRVRELRRRPEVPTGTPPPGENLVVLWDDPERQPGSGWLPASARSEAAGE